jgi:CheY-like chemotaxis protein
MARRPQVCNLFRRSPHGMNHLDDTTPPGAHPHVLVIDDHPGIAERIGRMLQRVGCRIRIAASATEGIAAFRAAQHGSERFDLVITDFSMADDNGLAVAAAIKAVTPPTPVVLLSAYALSEDDALPLHVDAVLTKPPTLDQLRALLSRLAGGFNA